MEIVEVTTVDEIEPLMSIVRTHQDDKECLKSIQVQLTKELGEVNDNRHIYIAYENEVVVAMIQLILKNADNDPDLADGKEIAHVHNLQVRHELQGRGIGFRMMEFIEEKAKSLGKTTITLGVDDGNANALHLYKKLGYETFKKYEGRTPDEFGYCMKKML